MSVGWSVSAVQAHPRGMAWHGVNEPISRSAMLMCTVRETSYRTCRIASTSWSWSMCPASTTMANTPVLGVSDVCLALDDESPLWELLDPVMRSVCVSFAWCPHRSAFRVGSRAHCVPDLLPWHMRCAFCRQQVPVVKDPAVSGNSSWPSTQIRKRLSGSGSFSSE